MATQPVTTTSRTGTNLTSLAVAANSGGDDWVNTGNELLYIETNGTAITLTLTLAATIDGQSATSKTVSIGANEEWIVGPFPIANYNNTTTGKAAISYSAVTNVKILIFKVGT